MLQLCDELNYKAGYRGFDSRWGRWDFSWTQAFQPHYVPEVDSASISNG